MQNHLLSLEEQKASKKKSNAEIIELEMMLNNEKELNAKNMELLLEEEMKAQTNK